MAAENPAIDTRLLERDRSRRRSTPLARDVGAVDVLFNCAGFVHHGAILDCTADAWTFSLDLNLTSMYRMIRAFLPAHARKPAAAASSTCRRLHRASAATPNRFVYGVTKAGVIGLTKSVAADYVARGIRCNAICPGTVATPSLEDRINAFDDPVSARADFIRRQPMGRLGTRAGDRRAGVFLASDESSYTTGAIHVVDGGWSM